MSHLGRPKEGEFDEQYSLAPVAAHLSGLLGAEVRLVRDYLEQPPEVAEGEVVVLENVRFNKGEKANDPELAKKYAALCDVFVMDAFGTAHRAQASTYGVAEYAKVSTKLTVLESLSQKVDQLIVGGGIANTFIAAAGYNVGKSLYEPDLVPEAKRLMEQAKAKGGEIPVPVDVVTGKEFSEQAAAETKKVDEVQDDDMIFDIGPETSEIYAGILKKAGTIVWNGPVGVFEFDQFGEGTRKLALAIADSPAFSIAGGGDTLAAIAKYGVADRISYISTGGGAFLEFLEGKKLPAVEILERRAAG